MRFNTEQKSGVPSMSHDVNNKVALVTGVSSGIGREIAQLLAHRGLRVFGTVHDHPVVIQGVEVVRLDVTSTSCIRALLVKPNFMKTGLGVHGKHTLADVDAYADARRRVTDAILEKIDAGSNPRAVAEIVYQAIAADRPRLRYPVGDGATLSRLRRYVPARMFDRSFRRQFRLDAAGSRS